MALILETVGFISRGWIRSSNGERLLLGDGPGQRWSPCEGSPKSIMDEVGLVVELFDLGVIGVDEIDNLLDGCEVLPFLFDE